MNEHVTPWLGAYHDGELRGRRLQQVETHLAHCAACRAELEELRALSALLQESPVPETFTRLVWPPALIGTSSPWKSRLRTSMNFPSGAWLQWVKGSRATRPL